jgi:phage-related protein (TIGR01555 family)
MPSLIFDGFSNLLARIGQGSENIMESTEYRNNNLTRDIHTLNALYRTNWVVKRLIDAVPEDMVKNWYKITAQLMPDKLARLKRSERRVQLRSKIIDGLRWGRLYGGAVGVIIINGHEDCLDEPLSLDMIMPGAFRGIIVLERWSGVQAGSAPVKNINDPEFGLPEYYDITSDAMPYGLRVHHSRIVRFPGRPLPYYEAVKEEYWGASELEHVFDEIKKRDNTSYNIASLVFLANLRVYKMEGFDRIGIAPEAVQKDLYSTLHALNSMMNNQGLQIIGDRDSLEEHQYSFSGLSEIYQLFMLDVAGAAEMPVTKLFGRSPAGFNATGESDLQNYYDSIQEKQESCLRPILDKLLPIMCMSEFGEIPDDLDFDFVNCRRPTEEEKKNLTKQIGEVVTGAFQAGIISQQTALKELKGSSDITGMWYSITDEDINQAETTSNPMGELPIASGNIQEQSNDLLL